MRLAPRELKKAMKKAATKGLPLPKKKTLKARPNKDKPITRKRRRFSLVFILKALHIILRLRLV